MRNYLDCSKQVVLNLCGQNVWKLIAKVTPSMNRPLNQSHCKAPVLFQVVEQSLKVSLPLCEVDLET